MYGRDLIEKHIITALLFSENYIWYLVRLTVRNQFHYRPEVPRGFQEVKVPRLRDNGPEW